MAEEARLRAATQRLASSPLEELPVVLPYTLRAIRECRNLLNTPTYASGKDAGKEPLQTADLKSLIKGYFKSKISVERWAAAVLVKTAVDVAGSALLNDCLGWARSLQRLLAGREHPILKQQCIDALTTIFSTAASQPGETRTITSTVLPQYIQECFKLDCIKFAMNKTDGGLSANPGRGIQLVESVLRSFVKLLPLFSTTFRPFGEDLSWLVRQLLAPDVSHDRRPNTKSLESNHEVVKQAQWLFSRLHLTGARPVAVNGQWRHNLDAIVQYCHESADAVFRGIVESSSFSREHDPDRRSEIEASEVQQYDHSQLGLSTWKGIHSGCCRFVRVLNLLNKFHFSRTTGSVAYPAASITILLLRVLSVVGPCKAESQNLRLNDWVSMDEREALFLHLPQIHIAALNVLRTLAARGGSHFLSMCPNFVPVFSRLFQQTLIPGELREHIYLATADILDICVMSPHIFASKHLDNIIKNACADTLPTRTDSPHNRLGNASTGMKKRQDVSPILPNANPATHSSSPHIPVSSTRAALTILSSYLNTIPPKQTPLHLRRQVDRAVILANNSRGMLASTMNPRPGESSILPFLARAHPKHLGTECLIRPRMPPIFTDAAMDDADADVSMRQNGEADGDESSGGLDAPTAKPRDPDWLSKLFGDGGGGGDLPEGEKITSEGPELPDPEQEDQQPPVLARGESVQAAEQLPHEPEAHPATARTGLTAPPAAHFPDPLGGEEVDGPVESPVSKPPPISKTPSLKRPASPPSLVGQSDAAAGESVKKPRLEQAGVGVGDEIDDDDDEFEVPPLTLEADTEDEDEEEEEDGEEDLGADLVGRGPDEGAGSSA